MFKTLVQNGRIKKAYGICEKELGIYPRRFLETMPREGREEIRGQLRKLQDEGIGIYDLAAVISAAHLNLLDDNVRYLVWSQVDHWRDVGKIEASTHQHFVEQARPATAGGDAPGFRPSLQAEDSSGVGVQQVAEVSVDDGRFSSRWAAAFFWFFFGGSALAILLIVPRHIAGIEEGEFRMLIYWGAIMLGVFGAFTRRPLPWLGRLSP